VDVGNEIQLDEDRSALQYLLFPQETDNFLNSLETSSFWLRTPHTTNDLVRNIIL